MNGQPDAKTLWIFWKTGSPIFQRPRRGVAVCVVGSELYGAFKSSRRKGRCRHAEEKLAKKVINDLKSGELRTKISKEEAAKIEIFQNYSPCGECAEFFSMVLKTFHTFNPNATLHVHFVCLYKIFWNMEGLRPPFITPEDHKKNVKGLLDLTTKGIQMKSFTSQTWAHLWNICMSDTNRPVPAVEGYPELFGQHRRDIADNKTAETFQRIIREPQF